LLAIRSMRTVGGLTIQSHAFAGRACDGERLVFGGTTLIVRASAEMTGGAFSVFEESAPLLDTSRHVHLNEDEMY
jgi:hypothetical protein